ncbi:MAG TPA: ABC transporter permease subunit [Acidimicrobiales bacterium]|nr:ABC transporter permease subunit [Acidimicrobiales bacterium]
MRLRGRPLNPVLAREVKERMRTRRTTIVVTVYLAVLALILQVVYSGMSGAQDAFGDSLATQSARLGRSLFETLLFFMLVLVCFIVPGGTADAVSGERERQTLVPLQVSLLSPRSILAGKLLSSVAFVFLLVLATLPLLGVSFVLGGVSVGDLARGVAAVLATGLVLACLALGCSSLARRTQGAMILAYGLTLFLALGTAMIYGAQHVLDDTGRRPNKAVLTLNPFFATADATGRATFDGFFGRFSTSSPFDPLRLLLVPEDQRFFGGFVEEEFRGQPMPMPMPMPVDGEAVEFFEEGDGGAFGVLPDGRPIPPEDAGGGIPFWARSVVVLGWIAGAAFLLATRRLRTPSDRAAVG